MRRIERNLELEDKWIAMILSKESEMQILGYQIADVYLDSYRKLQIMKKEGKLDQFLNVNSYGSIINFWNIRGVQLLQIALHNEKQRRGGNVRTSYYGRRREDEIRNPGEMC